MRYLSVDWQTLRPPDGDPWMPLTTTDFWPPLDSESLRDRSLPSLNRLIRHTLDEHVRGGYILANIVLLLSHLYEEVGLLAPLAGWQVRVGAETEATFTVSPSLLNGTNRFLATGAALYRYHLEGYGVWRGLPRYFRRETGHVLSFHSDDVPLPERSNRDFLRPEDALLTYLVPVGFRCVR